jgi:hypothetical protein
MTEIQAQVDTWLLIIGLTVVGALTLARLILMTYEDLRRTWKDRGEQ